MMPQVRSSRLVYDRDTAQFKGFGYVEFSAAADIDKALELDGAVRA